MKTRDRIVQYLNRYALPDSLAAADLVVRSTPSPFRRVVCVPMFDEDLQFVHRLDDHPDIEGTLTIAVVNAPDSAETSALKRTRDLWRRLLAGRQPHALSPHAVLKRRSARGGSHYMLLMDHCSPGRTLPDKQGVGLARKLGNDVALSLWQAGRLESPWLFQTDADATLPDNYFETPGELSECAAIHLDFEHTNAGGVSLAQRLYDLKLDYYVAGLAFAGSRFAHYSVGSSIVIHADFYGLVRGYARRSAGEDFYTLNKLAKAGRVAFDASRTVFLEERLSTRVPYGTGPGVARFESMPSPQTAAAFYAPDCFIALGHWLRFIEHSARSAAGDPAFDARARFRVHVGKATATDTLCAALEHLDLFAWLATVLRGNERPAQAFYQTAIGMDALKTLRLIHALRDHGFGNVDALTAADWVDDHPSEQVRSRCDGHRGLIGV